MIFPLAWPWGLWTTKTCGALRRWSQPGRWGWLLIHLPGRTGLHLFSQRLCPCGRVSWAATHLYRGLQYIDLWFGRPNANLHPGSIEFGASREIYDVPLGGRSLEVTFFRRFDAFLWCVVAQPQECWKKQFTKANNRFWTPCIQMFPPQLLKSWRFSRPWEW